VNGKVALVTGGASGIGRATVERLIEAGAEVLVADLSVGDGPGTARCDVSDPEQIEAAVQAAVDQFGGLDILINNAGKPLTGVLTDTSLEDLLQVFAINVGGVFNGIKAAAPRIAERGGGAIVNTASWPSPPLRRTSSRGFRFRSTTPCP